MQKILIVDDDTHMRALVKTYAEIEGYLCFEASDGFQTLSEIRGSCNTPVIMITARKEEYDKLFGFNLGADDYIAKPFSPKELMARIKAVLKRSSQFQFEKIVYGDLEVNVFSHTVTIKGNPLPLTPKEFDLLVYLTKNNHIALSRESILEGVWGFDYFGDTRTVDTHIKSLRERLGDYRELIQTVWGVGYKFDYED